MVQDSPRRESLTRVARAALTSSLHIDEFRVAEATPLGFAGAPIKRRRQKQGDPSGPGGAEIPATSSPLVARGAIGNSPGDALMWGRPLACTPSGFKPLSRASGIAARRTGESACPTPIWRRFHAECPAAGKLCGIAGRAAGLCSAGDVGAGTAGASSPAVSLRFSGLRGDQDTLKTRDPSPWQLEVELVC
jgi:hypothetical protein